LSTFIKENQSNEISEKAGMMPLLKPPPSPSLSKPSFNEQTAIRSSLSKPPPPLSKSDKEGLFISDSEEKISEISDKNHQDNPMASLSHSFKAPFPVPLEIQQPLSEKQHEIIYRTAKFVVSQLPKHWKQEDYMHATPKCELLLKLKHGNNPNFEFLLKSSPMYHYYQFVKYNLETIEDWMQLNGPQASGTRTNTSSISLSKKSFSPNTSEESMVDAMKEPIPPRDIQCIIEKLVEYTARYGEEFLETLRVKEKDNPKFSFLFFGDPFHEYFQRKKREQSFKASSVQSNHVSKESSPLVSNLVTSKTISTESTTHPPNNLEVSNVSTDCTLCSVIPSEKENEQHTMNAVSENDEKKARRLRKAQLMITLLKSPYGNQASCKHD